MVDDVLYNWTTKSLLEVELPEPDSFLKIKETLTRIGVASKKDKKLYQSAHILHKQGKYYIVHFKELFLLDNKDSNITVNDIDRRNAIAILLEDWDLLKVINKPKNNTSSMISQIKVIPFSEKDEWDLVAKYAIGQKRIKKV